MAYDKTTLQTSLDHVPENIQGDIRTATQWLTENCPFDIAMIWLFGSYARGDFINESRVTKDGMVSKYQSDVDILVVIQGKSTNATQRKMPPLLADLQDIEGLSAPFHCIYESAARFNSALRKGEYFYQDVVSEGVVLLDNSFELAKPQTLTLPERRALSIRYFERFFGKASQFHSMFEFNFQRGQLVGGIYNLHQMTEHLFASYLATMTHYKPRTHRLFELRAETKKLNRHISEIFPSVEKQDKKDFSFFCDAYIDARYKEHYDVNDEQIDRLMLRVEAFQHWVYEECLRAIDSFVPEENYSQNYLLYYPLMNVDELKARPLVEDVLNKTRYQLKESESKLGESEFRLGESEFRLAESKVALEEEMAKNATLLKKLRDAGIE
ncbi:hypothetical protein A9Q99_27490 [Gammaproteobacteria bacterium 45_16_T64]|nr:hypothetical protein A9Q99_27490 [Gammaproteobacteria bacterium 45_16_T64]